MKPTLLFLLILNPDGTTSDALKPDRLLVALCGGVAWADAVKPILDKLLNDAGVTPRAAATESK